jgi:hypothetical protein
LFIAEKSVAETLGKFTKPNAPDDRAEFEAERRRNSLALGAGMSRALLKFEKRALLFKSYAASAI